MSGEAIGRDTVLLCRPSECECRAVELLFRYLFFVEVPFAHHEEVTGGVIACCGVADEVRIPQLVDVSPAVDAEVISDIDPAFSVLVIVLVLAESSGRVGVVAENDGGVVDRHEVGGMRRATAPGR